MNIRSREYDPPGVTVSIDTRGLSHPRPRLDERTQHEEETEGEEAGEREKGEAEGEKERGEEKGRREGEREAEASEEGDGQTDLGRYLEGNIRIHGPLPLATYMKECLTHPAYGYYMKERRTPESKERERERERKGEGERRERGRWREKERGRS